MAEHQAGGFYQATRGVLRTRYGARVALAAVISGLIPTLALGAALILLDAGGWLALALLSTAALGVLAGAAAVRALLRPVEHMGETLAPYAAGRAGAAAGEVDAVTRIACGFAELSRRLDAATRRGDPARLDDPLTGLPNRLAVMRRGRDEITRARRKGDGLSVAVIALVESGEGSAPISGEDALRIAAEALVQSLRAYDVLGRWDGPRFVAMLPEAEIEHAVSALRRAEADAAHALDAQGVPGRHALKAGVAVLQPDDATLADVATRAELALERALAGHGGGDVAAPGPRSRPARLTSVE